MPQPRNAVAEPALEQVRVRVQAAVRADQADSLRVLLR
jgi:hypothetical protein